MLRLALAVFAALHGIAHFVGFAVPWRLLQAEEMPYATTLLGGRLDVGDTGIRIVGLVWLALGLAFVGAGVVTGLDRSGWPRLVLLVAGASLVWSVLGWPAARIGVAVNLGLLAVVGAGLVWGWW